MIQQDDQLPHDGGEGDFAGFAGGDEPVVKRLENGAAAGPAGPAAAAWRRSLNPRTCESVAQPDPSALLRPELEPLPERRRTDASSYPQE